MANTRSSRAAAQKSSGFYKESEDDEYIPGDNDDTEDEYQPDEVVEAKVKEIKKVEPVAPKNAAPDYSSKSCKVCNNPYFSEDNDGCFSETPTFLPCGHIFGNTCISARYTCPYCPTKLQYPVCGDRIPGLATYVWQANGTKHQVPPMCLECTIFAIDNGDNLRGYKIQDLLNEVAYWTYQRELWVGSSHKVEAISAMTALHFAHEKLRYHERCVQDVIEAREFLGW